MRKRRILSLLLAVAVMATMLIAVPLTASAAEEITFGAYAKPFKSTNQNYVDWTYHQTTSIDQSDPDKPKQTSDSMMSYKDSVKISFGDFTSNEIKQNSGGDFVVINDDFDLPHNEHVAHPGTSGYVAKSNSSSYLEITNAIPDGCDFKSYDLILVYNRDSNSSGTTKFTISDSQGSFSKQFSDESSNNFGDDGNSKKTDPDEVIFKNITSNSVKLSWNVNVDIYSVSLDYHEKDRQEVDLIRGEKDYVSGIYYENDVETEGEARGVIRFFQDYSGEADGYGFVFIDGNGDFVEGTTTINDGRIVKSNDGDGTLSGKSGFYGDVYNILETNFEPGVIAVPYVSVDGYIIFAKESIKGTVDETNKVIHEPEWEWTITE